MPQKILKIISIILFFILIVSVFSVITVHGIQNPDGVLDEIILVRDTEIKDDMPDLEMIDEYGQYSLIRTNERGISELKNKGIDVNELPSRTEISVKGHTFDIFEEEPDVEPELMIEDYGSGEEGLYIVHMLGPINPGWIETIEEKGVEIINYVPNYAYEVKMTPEKAGDIEDLSFVDWVGIYQPGFKLSEDIELGHVEIRLTERVEKEFLMKMSSKIDPVDFHEISFWGDRIFTEVRDEKDLIKIARMPEVYYISNRAENKLLDEVATQIIGGGSWIWDPDDDPYNPWRGSEDEFDFGAHVNHLGYTGEGITVAVADTGINPDHLDFQDRVIGGYHWEGDTWEDDHGHGSHVTGSIAGNTYNGTGTTLDQFGSIEELGSYYAAQGPSYESELFAQKIFDSSGNWIGPGDYFDILQKASENSEAYIHSNSWGDDDNPGEYLKSSQDYDEGVRDSDRDSEENRPMVIVVAAGNEGDDYNTIGAPATAKNVIAVGSTENFMPDHGRNNPDMVSSFSSRGWTDDNRVKPDLVAPGEAVYSTGHDSDTHYYASQGTSMSAPAVSGAASIVVEWYEDEFGEKPSPAMVRALLINTAYDLDDENGNTGPIPNRDEGWGMVNLPALMDTPFNFELHDQDSLLTTGEQDEYEIVYDDENEPLKITLTWTDKEAQEGDLWTLKNNLDLELETPSGESIKGNAFDLSGDGESDDGFTYPSAEVLGDFDTSGDGWDDVNNVQNIYIPPDDLEQGAYTVRVIGRDITSDSNNDGLFNQDYSLVTQNSLRPEPQPPSNPEPEDSAIGVQTDVELSVQVEHGLEEPMDVDFFDASDDELIGTDEDVESGDRAYTSWENLAYETDYGWYAIAYDDEDNASSDTWTFTTVPESYFHVKIIEPEDEEEFVENDEINVDYKIQNIGDEEDIQDIDFAVYDESDEEIHSETKEDIQLGSDEIHDETFGWIPEETGEYDLEVTTEDDSDSVSVNVIADSFFELRILNVDREVVEGDDVLIEYRVENTGGIIDTQTINFTVDGELIDEKEMTVSEQDFEDGEFIWQTEESDAGRYEIGVSSDDDEDDARVRVYEADVFAIDVELRDRDLYTGEEIVVNYSVMNTKDYSDTQDIRFTVNDELKEKVHYDIEEDLSLGSRESYEGEFTWITENTGNYEIKISSEDDNQTNRIRIWKPDSFSIIVQLRGRHEDDIVLEGYEVRVEYMVRNTKDETDTQDITFFVDDELIEADEEVTLEEGEEQRDEFYWTVESPFGERVLSVSSDDDSAQVTLEVFEGPYFEVEIDRPEEGQTFHPDEMIIVEFTITNTGDLEAEQYISISLDGETIEEITLKLGPGDTEDLRVEFFAEENRDQHRISVVSQDDHETVNINVETEEDEDLEIPGFTYFHLLLSIFVALFIHITIKKKVGNDDH